MKQMENPFERLEFKLETLTNKIDLLEKNFGTFSAIKNETSDLPTIGGIDLAVNLTGYKKSTIYKLTALNKIPHVKLGGKIRFYSTDLLKWIKNDSIKE